MLSSNLASFLLQFIGFESPSKVKPLFKEYSTLRWATCATPGSLPDDSTDNENLPSSSALVVRVKGSHLWRMWSDLGPSPLTESATISGQDLFFDLDIWATPSRIIASSLHIMASLERLAPGKDSPPGPSTSLCRVSTRTMSGAGDKAWIKEKKRNNSYPACSPMHELYH